MYCFFSLFYFVVGDEKPPLEVGFELGFREVGVSHHITPEFFEGVEWFAVEEGVRLVGDVGEFVYELREVGEVVVEHEPAILYLWASVIGVYAAVGAMRDEVCRDANGLFAGVVAEDEFGLDEGVGVWVEEFPISFCVVRCEEYFLREGVLVLHFA